MSSQEEEERRKAEARARISEEIASLQKSLDDFLKIKEKLVKQKDELDNFKTQFTNQFNECCEGFNNISNSFGNISYSEKSQDSSISILKKINQNTANYISDTTKEMDEPKNQLDNKIMCKEDEINEEIFRTDKKIEDIKSKIASLQSQLNAL